ncbi:acyl-CoA dehydrogenase family protein [Aeromicrobium sp.]|uniref:acyl-CoA dehydrogenase family protein n=1 Tax=Aeromicrobium sp. TaxID=1871063 RepID=UPI002FC8199F
MTTYANSVNARPDYEATTRHPIFNDDHEQLRKTIRAFAEKELAPHADEWEETTFPSSVFKRMGELGFLGLDKPEEYGGQGGDYASELVLAEEIVHSNSGGLAMAVAVHVDIAMPPIIAFGSEEQKQQWIVPAIAGEKILCLGITEPEAGSDVSQIKTRAVKDGDDYVINGSKMYITNGHRADAIVLVTKTDPDAGYGGFTMFLVPMDTPGVIREKKLKKLGMHASDTALLVFQDVRVPASAVIGEVGKGFYQIMWQLQGERLIAAAGCVSQAQKVFDDTLRYAKERSTFGKVLGTHQVIRHKFAEMAVQIELARQQVYSCAARVQNGDYPVREISIAKLNAARMVVAIADECIQIHGGAGYMTEYGIERVWRDMRLNRIGGGTDEILLDVVGRSYGL